MPPPSATNNYNVYIGIPSSLLDRGLVVVAEHSAVVHMTAEKSWIVK
jgi:hypothetical protein